MSEGIAVIDEELDSIKDTENFIGFCAFNLFLDNDESRTKEGMIKISRSYKKDKTGFLKFTFIVDVYGDKDEREKVLNLFARFHDSSLSSDLDPDFMYMNPQEPKSQKDKAWFIGDVFFNFKNCKDATKEHVVNFFIPFLTLRLPIEFHDLQWWDENDDTDACACTEKRSAIKAISNFIKKRFS